MSFIGLRFLDFLKNCIANEKLIDHLTYEIENIEQISLNNLMRYDQLLNLKFELNVDYGRCVKN